MRLPDLWKRYSAIQRILVQAMYKLRAVLVQVQEQITSILTCVCEENTLLNVSCSKEGLCKGGLQSALGLSFVPGTALSSRTFCSGESLS